MFVVLRSSLVRVSQLAVPLNVQCWLWNKNKIITVGFLVQSVKHENIDVWTTFSRHQLSYWSYDSTHQACFLTF